MSLNSLKKKKNQDNQENTQKTLIRTNHVIKQQNSNFNQKQKN